MTGSSILGHIQYIHISPISKLSFQMSLCHPLVVLSGIDLVSLSQSHPHTYRLPSHQSPPAHTHKYMNIHTPRLPLCLCPGLSGVVDSVVNTLGAPEWIGVVKLEQVDSTAGVLVAAGIHLFMTVPPVHRHNLIHLGLPCLLLRLLLLTGRLTYMNNASRGKQEGFTNESHFHYNYAMLSLTLMYGVIFVPQSWEQYGTFWALFFFESTYIHCSL